jgi:hypothetical protein
LLVENTNGQVCGNGAILAYLLDLLNSHVSRLLCQKGRAGTFKGMQLTDKDYGYQSTPLFAIIINRRNLINE